MFYYKVIDDTGKFLGYSASSEAVEAGTLYEVSEEEYNNHILQFEAQQKQQEMVEEQAELLSRRAEGNLSKAESAYIEARLDEISDYWDSLEPKEATYGTDN